MAPRNAMLEGVKLEVYNMELVGIGGQLRERYNCWHPDMGTLRVWADELVFIDAPFEQVKSQGLVEVEKAVAFVKSHQLASFWTADGFVVRGDALYVQGPQFHEAAHDDGDAWFEELNVFPMPCGMVDLRAVRAWLGY